jgi:hypothetical protein
MDDETRNVIGQVADALQTAVLLATRVRQRDGDEAIQLEAAVDRAARALKRLEPKEGRI